MINLLAEEAILLMTSPETLLKFRVDKNCHCDSFFFLRNKTFCFTIFIQMLYFSLSCVSMQDAVTPVPTP